MFQTFREERAGKARNVEDYRHYQIQAFSLQSKSRWLEVLDLAALFLLRKETCSAENW